MTTMMSRKNILKHQFGMKFINNGIFFKSKFFRKKLKTTEYIYQQLFVKGEKSDVTLLALEQEWNLHKVYLSQVRFEIFDRK